MSIKIISGNIFTSQCQVIVNTVNCVGVMGAGIALECRLRYPEMYDKYIQYCLESKINIGNLWIYKTESRWILNFPTKKHWKNPSKIEYLHAGLDYISKTTKLRKAYIVKVIDAMQSSSISQLNQLARVHGIGIKTLETIFNLARSSFVSSK